MSDWISFFDSDHSIYVSARHRAAHARITGDGMLAHLRPGDRVLDYGCGEAAYAERVAQTASKVFLCEAAPNLRASLASRVLPTGEGRLGRSRNSIVPALPGAAKGETA